MTITGPLLVAMVQRTLVYQDPEMCNLDGSQQAVRSHLAMSTLSAAVTPS
jgi:hypothetical protein